MTFDASLPDDLALCHALIRRLAEQNTAQQSAFEEQRRVLEEKERVLEEVDASYHELLEERDLLKAELEQFRRWAYGRRTERIREADGQRHLFELEPDVLPLPNEEEVPPDEPPASPRRKKRRSQKDKLDHLPTRLIPLDVSEEEKHCERCGGEKTKIGEDERRVLQYQPAVLEVEVYVLPKYACPCCQDGVVSPPPPERIFPRSIAGPGLVSEIVVSKFSDHLPLYRQEDRFTRLGLFLSRSTLVSAHHNHSLVGLGWERTWSAGVGWGDSAGGLAAGATGRPAALGAVGAVAAFCFAVGADRFGVRGFPNVGT